MLVYSQSTGRLTVFGTDQLLGTGYSGFKEGRNNPDAQDRQAVGPIPRGFWRIGDAYTSKRVGPVTIPLYKLDDVPGDDVDAITGRSAFRIHGDNSRGDQSASRGCIILPRIVREAVANSQHEILRVVK